MHHWLQALPVLVAGWVARDQVDNELRKLAKYIERHREETAKQRRKRRRR